MNKIKMTIISQRLVTILSILSYSLGLGKATLAEDFALQKQTAVAPKAGIQIPENNQTSQLLAQINPMGRVTSVSQLSDVQPTDWAFAALQSLVERYGCIEGYPDRTYRGNRAMTRYEFAAGLNACLEQIVKLIPTGSNNNQNNSGLKPEDLETIRRLQTEFSSELTTLRSRIDSLEARATQLENRQFSTTTKLTGQAIIFFADSFGENADPANNTTFSYQTYLNFSTSFTGKDSLVVSLEAGNVQKFDTATQFPEGILSGSTDETRLLSANNESTGDNQLSLSILQYVFPIGDKLRVSLDAYASTPYRTAALSSLNNYSTGAISFYGRLNPLLYPFSQQTGIGVEWQPTPWAEILFSVGSEAGENPAVGLFDGGYNTAIRPAINFGRFRLAGAYIHSYSPEFGIDTVAGSNASKVLGAGPVAANTYVLAAFYRFNPTFEMSGSVGYSNARTLGEGTKGDAQVWDYRVNLVLHDLGKKGNVAGLIFGTQPRLAGTSNDALAQAIGLPEGQRSDRDTGYHIEAFYAYRINDNIAVTPGFFWLTAPNHDQRNPDVFIGAIRTTFDF